MKDQVRTIDNEQGITFSVMETRPYERGTRKKGPKQVTFIIGGIIPEHLNKEGDLTISITKEEAENLAMRILIMTQ